MDTRLAPDLAPDDASSVDMRSADSEIPMDRFCSAISDAASRDFSSVQVGGLTSVELLDAAIRVVAYASRLAVEVQDRLSSGHLSSLEKSDLSPMTVADLGVQCLVTEYLSAVMPVKEHFRLMGEEDAGHFEERGPTKELVEISRLLNTHFPFEDLAGSSGVRRPAFTVEDILSLLRRGSESGGSSGSFWVLDPIDGTKGFLRNSQYAIGLGLVVDGIPTLGVMACPNLPPRGGDPTKRAEGRDAGYIFGGHSSWVGTLALQPFLMMLHSKAASTPLGHMPWPEQAITLKVDSCHILSEAILCESFESGHRDGDGIRPRSEQLKDLRVVRLDSMAKYGLVARGDAHVYLRGSYGSAYNEKLWDHCAAALLVKAAGGRVTDLHGNALDFGAGRMLSRNQGVLATNGLLHDEILLEIERLKHADRISAAADTAVK